MTFATYESSIESGGPVQLYRFVYGSGAGEYYGYTSHSEAITVDHGGSVGSKIYLPVPVQRDNLISNGTLDRAAVRMDFDIGTDLAEIFRIYPPSQVVTLTIYEGHLDDPDGQFVVIWAGRVVAAQRNKSELQLSGEPISTQLKRPGLRRHYQFGCPHVLYGDECGANRAAATVTGAVASITGTVVSLDSGWEGAFDASKFIRGVMEWTPAGGSIQRRTILRVSGDDLTLSGLPIDLAASDAVDVILGCNHQAFTADGGDCQGLHNNIVNFGGQPWIPLKNVINKNPYY